MFSIFIDGLFIENDLQNRYDSKRSIDIIFEEAKKNKFDRFVLLQNGSITDVPEGIKNVVISDLTPANIIETIIREAKNSDDILFFDAGSPFYDYEFINKMIERHTKYFADYTYCIGYPEGLVPTIIKKDALKEFLSLADSVDVLTPNYLFDILSKDINSFDIETFLSDIDLRIYRIKFGENDRGERLLTEKIFNSLKNKKVEEITQYLINNLDKIYTIPYMIELELNNKLPVKPIYYPENIYSDNELNIDFVKKILEEIKNINPKINLVLGGFSEPFNYKEIFEILKFTYKLNITTIVETFGYTIDEKFINDIIEANSNVIIVVKLDAYTEATYNKINYGGDFNRVKKSYSLLKNSSLKVYKQVTRMLENETEIEMFIKNKEADDLIIRKYSTFCNTIQDRKVVDLTPLERIPCFHLRREIFINSNKNLMLCYYCIIQKLLDLEDSTITEAIKKLELEYIENANKNYRECCKKCDDYYIFNF
ncbi:MAG TPA: spiro-SPASM protein [Spirochaetota bacterium]|nr:spiro-SPASM protein [Spirochaetota bacterium]